MTRCPRRGGTPQTLTPDGLRLTLPRYQVLDDGRRYRVTWPTSITRNTGAAVK